MGITGTNMLASRYNIVAIPCAVIAIGSALLSSNTSEHQVLFGAVAGAAALLSVLNYFVNKRTTHAEQGGDIAATEASRERTDPAVAEDTQHQGLTFNVQMSPFLAYLYEKPTLAESPVDFAGGTALVRNKSDFIASASVEIANYLLAIRSGDMCVVMTAAAKKKVVVRSFKSHVAYGRVQKGGGKFRDQPFAMDKFVTSATDRSEQLAH